MEKGFISHLSLTLEVLKRLYVIVWVCISIRQT